MTIIQTRVVAGNLSNGLLISHIHGELDTVGKGTEVIPTILRPHYKQLQGREELL